MTVPAKIKPEDRCVHTFERRAKGLRYVLGRWRCKRKKLKGSDFCWYCEPPWEKGKRKSRAVGHLKS